MFLSERESELASVKSTLSHAEQTLEQQRTLIARLEEDIARGLSNSGVTSAQASADDIGALLQTQSTDRTATSGADLGAMLKIISNQRDRFKTLVTQLEGVRIALEAALTRSLAHSLTHSSIAIASCAQDVAELQKQLAQQRGQVASLQSDNVKLYEKIRYLESYSNISRGRRDVTDIEAGAVGSGAKDDAIETKYHKLYEDSVNPFVLFNKKVRITTTASSPPPEHDVTDRLLAAFAGEVRPLQRAECGREGHAAHGRLLPIAQVLAHLHLLLHHPAALLHLHRHLHAGTHVELLACHRAAAKCSRTLLCSRV